MSTLKDNWKNPFKVLDWSRDRSNTLWIPLIMPSAITKARKKVTGHISRLDGSSVSTIITLIIMKNSYTGIF